MHPRNAAALAYDALAAVLAWCLAYWLRFNFEIPEPFQQGMLKALLLVVPIQAAAFLLCGLYRGIWRYASITDMQRIGAAVGIAAVVIPGVLLVTGWRVPVPRSVFLLDPILLVLMMAGARVAYRGWKEHRRFGRSLLRGEPVVVIGSGEAAAALVSELRHSSRYRVVALFDDSPNRVGRVIHGVPVVGDVARLAAYVVPRQVLRAIVALPAAAASARRRAVEVAQQAGLAVLTVPAFDDIASGRVAISQLREVEVEDLLGRDQVELDAAAIGELITGRVVLVTGAGGSIGSELCRQIAVHAPARLVFFELNEFALYQVCEEFRQRWPTVSISAVIGDVKDRARVSSVFGRFSPDIVFHAAAYKHVPLMEEENAWQAVRNNVIGTAVVATESRRHGVREFVLISTDKAVNPTNVMGATKRLAERVCRSWSDEAVAPGRQAAAGCRFVTVRFGNVLASAGSVIPKFRAQIAAGGPVTVTHPEIQRYFMSIPEAAQLVLQAGLMGQGREIFVLEMGEPIRIADLARDMIRLSGFSEDDIRVEFTGLRPGEKLYEELLADDELTVRTRHPKIRIARDPGEDRDEWRERLLAEIAAADEPDDEVARAWISRWVPEYRPAV